MKKNKLNYFKNLKIKFINIFTFMNKNIYIY